MANIRFVLGPLGGGQVEIGGEVASFIRAPGVMPPFAPLEKIENNVYYGWLSDLDFFNEIEEFKHMQSTASLVTAYNTINRAHTIITENPTITDFVFLCGATSLFVEELLQEFPNAIYYFTKRQDSQDNVSLMISHARERDVCACGNDHNIAISDASFQNYVHELNQQITTAVDTKLTQLGYSWTEGNLNVGVPTFEPGRSLAGAGGINNEEKRVHTEVLFLAPAQVAVYKATGSPLVHGFSEFHNMHSY
jgi:hypothetical protein